MTGLTFSPVEGFDDVHVARRGKLNCFAIRLGDDSICLYSPVAGLEVATRGDLAELGHISAILAPNHYHNKGLKGHAAAFPSASLTCSKAAEPRLKKLTGLTFDPIGCLNSRLAKHQCLLEPEGLKTGEVWFEIRTPTRVAWIVTDAFSAKLHPPGVCADAPTTLGSFPRYGVKNAAVFKDWVRTQLATRPPTVLLSCHGSPVHAQNLDAQIDDLLADGL